MKSLKSLLLLATLMTTGTLAIAQQQPSVAVQSKLTQKVRGQVVDAASRQPLAGVIVLLASDNQINTTTDARGYFTMSQVPVGRQTFQFSLTGFENYVVTEASVISGKELELNVSLKESLHQLDEVVVSAGKDKARPMNEFATVSSRSFSVEETRRYAAAFSDPARMAQNFPGVSNAGDQDNSIVVRGNSPKGVLWRLEGIEIPNPNHFSGLGATGGAISMLNANVLGNSDFYTGAFPAEIGNALAGAFDLNFRNGNTEQREHTVQIGALGVELATEGPFKKGGKSSYLINYRYSTLALLGRFLDLGGVQPEYQDASFKLNFPTEKAGTFSVFGLGGYNKAVQHVKADSSVWDGEENENLRFKDNTMMGVAGVSHQYFLNKKSYIRTVLSASYDKSASDADTLNPADNYKVVPVQHTSGSNTAYRLSVMYNNKINARHTFRTGIIAQQMAYDMDYNYYDTDEAQWKTIISGNGQTQFYQGYLQVRSRLSERWSMTAGVHGSYFALNSKYTIEPRASIAYEVNQHKMTLAAGFHSKPDHISTYFYQNVNQADATTFPNKNLDLLKAFHAVAGYSTMLPGKLRLKTEVYYQKLYDIAVEKDVNSSFSVINAQDVFSLMETKKPLVSEGTGQNYGIDISVERPFSNNYYMLLSGSLYKSTYTNYKGDEYSTRYNRNYQMNLIGGKEFKLSANGRKVLGLNGKILYSGGMRESKIDLAQSIANKEQVLVPGEYFTQVAPAYFRADIGIYYKFNSRRATHSIQFDVQNVTNRKNYYFSYFDSKSGSIKQVNQLGFFPNISYRIDFHW